MNRRQRRLAAKQQNRRVSAKNAGVSERLASADGQRLEGRLEAAAATYREIVAQAPKTFAAWANLGAVCQELARTGEATAAYETALALDPGSIPVLSNLAVLAQQLGDRGRAAALYRRLLDLAPNEAEAHHDLAQVKKFTNDDPDLAAMRRLRADPGLDRQSAMYLDFGLAKAHDDLGDFGRAFRHMAAANRAKRQTLTFDLRFEEKLVDRLIEQFTAERIETLSGGGFDTSAPIFVLGMPRSGTTLIEQILASHSDVAGAGELNLLGDSVAAEPAFAGGARYPEALAEMTAGCLRDLGETYADGLQARSPGAARITDKMPRNHYFIGVIALALPGARIVHCRRSPLDTCLSCYSKHFPKGQLFSYDLAELGAYYRLYDRLMAHWHEVLPGRVLDVQYEDVVAEPEPQIRRILAACELSWQDDCLQFHRTERPVMTASAGQVREPLYDRSVGRWKAYENDLGPLIEALGPLAW